MTMSHATKVGNWRLGGATDVVNVGVLISTSSESKVYGVKSEISTTDGYMALPLTTQSTEFFVASWPSVPCVFFALRCKLCRLVVLTLGLWRGKA